MIQAVVRIVETRLLDAGSRPRGSRLPRMHRAGPSTHRKSPRAPGAVSRARRIQRTVTGPDDGRHSRLISPYTQEFDTSPFTTQSSSTSLHVRIRAFPGRGPMPHWGYRSRPGRDSGPARQMSTATRHARPPPRGRGPMRHRRGSSPGPVSSARCTSLMAGSPSSQLRERARCLRTHA